MVCNSCPAKEEYAASPWFNNIWFLYQLQEGGYPFDRDELTLEEWLALAEIKAGLNEPPEKPQDG